MPTRSSPLPFDPAAYRAAQRSISFASAGESLRGQRADDHATLARPARRPGSSCPVRRSGRRRGSHTAPRRTSRCQPPIRTRRRWTRTGADPRRPRSQASERLGTARAREGRHRFGGPPSPRSRPSGNRPSQVRRWPHAARSQHALPTPRARSADPPRPLRPSRSSTARAAPASPLDRSAKRRIARPRRPRCRRSARRRSTNRCSSPRSRPSVIGSRPAASCAWIATRISSSASSSTPGGRGSAPSKVANTIRS